MRRYTMVPCLSIFASGRGAVGSFWRYWWFPFAIDLLLTGIGRLSGCRHGLWLLPFTVRRLFGGADILQSPSSSSSSSSSSHPHTCRSRSSHPHTCRSRSSHPHICRSTSSHPHICRSTSSHPHICRSTSSHLHICRSPLALLLFSLKAGAVPPERHETQPFRTKWTLDVQNLGKIAILKCPSQPFRTKWTLDAKN